MDYKKRVLNVRERELKPSISLLKTKAAQGIVAISFGGQV